jgi:hypothetical protein
MAFFNWKIEGDSALARHDFEQFLANDNSTNFPKERELASQWVHEIESESESHNSA